MGRSRSLAMLRAVNWGGGGLSFSPTARLGAFGSYLDYVSIRMDP